MLPELERSGGICQVYSMWSDSHGRSVASVNVQYHLRAALGPGHLSRCRQYLRASMSTSAMEAALSRSLVPMLILSECCPKLIRMLCTTCPVTNVHPNSIRNLSEFMKMCYSSNNMLSKYCPKPIRCICKTCPVRVAATVDQTNVKALCT